MNKPKIQKGKRQLVKQYVWYIHSRETNNPVQCTQIHKTKAQNWMSIQIDTKTSQKQAITIELNREQNSGQYVRQKTNKATHMLYIYYWVSLDVGWQK